MANKLQPFICCALGLLAAGVVAGCKNTGSEYVAPAVEGRVLDAETRLPVYRAKVRRASPSAPTYDDFMRKGAQRMEDHWPAYTDKEGRFSIDSEKALVLFAQMNWFSINVICEHSGYDRFITNYTLFTATNSASGAPLVKTGDILLRRTQNKKAPKPL